MHSRVHVHCNCNLITLSCPLQIISRRALRTPVQVNVGAFSNAVRVPATPMHKTPNSRRWLQNYYRFRQQRPQTGSTVVFGDLASAVHHQVQTMSKYLRHSRSSVHDALEHEPLLPGSPGASSRLRPAVDDTAATGKGASDLSTVASLLSSMTGAGVLSLPWAYARCGLLGSLLVTAATALVMT